MCCVSRWLALGLILLLTGCQDLTDDLAPSGADKRPAVQAGSSGGRVGQLSPDFTIEDTLYTPHSLYTELTGADAVVLYFTMWCPICDSHSSHLRRYVVPEFPNVRFFLVDYVDDSVAASRAAQMANGYTDFTVLADVDDRLETLYDAAMGTTVVIDSTGIVRMNEDYKNGDKLRQTLESLP